MSEKRWLRVKEAAEILNISSKSIYDLCAAGQLPATRIGGVIRIDKIKLEKQLNDGVESRQKRAAR